LRASIFWNIVVLLLRYSKFVRSIEIRMNKSRIFKASILFLYIRKFFLWSSRSTIRSRRWFLVKFAEETTSSLIDEKKEIDDFIDSINSFLIRFTNFSILSRLIIISMIKNHSSQSSKLLRITVNFWFEITLNKDIFRNRIDTNVRRRRNAQKENQWSRKKRMMNETNKNSIIVDDCSESRSRIHNCEATILMNKNVSRDVTTHNIEDCENRVLMIKRSQK
jgi:hypothetical protein